MLFLRRMLAALGAIGIGLMLSDAALAQARYALVIGNADYPSAPLANPVNDARDMAAKLRERGFQVEPLLNASKRQMEQSIRNFTRKLGGKNTVGVFYYAGHGLEIKGENYLVPTDAVLRDETDARYDTVHAGKLLDRMNEANNGVNLVILDACRNNPFKRGWRSAGAGLAQMQPAAGTLILYATEPHRQAADGSGRNGAFTKHLLKAMDRPGVAVEMVFKQVSAQVSQETGGEQIPWFEGVIHGNFYFLAPVQVIQAPATPTGDAEASLWLAMQDCGTPACLRAYLDSYPAGRFAAAAKALLAAQSAPPVPPPAAPDPAQREAALGLRRQERAPVQQALNALGHAVGAADGIWGRNTRAGIAAWQKANGREASGYLTAAGYKRLLAQAEPILAAARRQAAAKPLPQSPIRRDPTRGMEFVSVPAGCFQMGSPTKEAGRDDNETAHRVCVDAFKLGKHEVTRA